MAEQAGPLLAVRAGRVELRRVRDAVVAGDRRRRVALGEAPRLGARVGPALGALDVAVERAGGDALAGVLGDLRLGVGDEALAVDERVLAGADRRPLRADGTGVALLADLLRRDPLLLARGGALALARGVVAQSEDDRDRDRESAPRRRRRRRSAAGGSGRARTARSGRRRSSCTCDRPRAGRRRTRGTAAHAGRRPPRRPRAGMRAPWPRGRPVAAGRPCMRKAYMLLAHDGSRSQCRGRARRRPGGPDAGRHRGCRRHERPAARRRSSALQQWAGGRTVDTLAGGLRLSHSRTVRVIDRLEADGLAVRERDPGDGRGVLVRLTPEGERVATRVHRRAGRGARDAALAGLAPADRRTLAAAAEQVLEHVTTGPPQRGGDLPAVRQPRVRPPRGPLPRHAGRGRSGGRGQRVLALACAAGSANVNGGIEGRVGLPRRSREPR